MRTNVFLRSTRRQPVRAVLLLLVTALVTFTFVGRASEYLLIEQETARLESYYQAVGTLKAVTRNARESSQETAEILQANPYVQIVERRQYVSGVMQEEYCNADTDFNSIFGNSDIFFYGTLRAATPTSFTFLVDTALAGLPECRMKEGEFYQLVSDGPLTAVYEEMEVGVRYLVRGKPQGISSQKSDLSREGDLENAEIIRVDFVPLLPTKGLWYYEVPEGQTADFNDPKLTGVEDAIRTAYEEQRALNVVPTQDMTALPETQEMSPAICLVDGRWIDSTDNLSNKKACVIHAGLTKLRGLTVGDTITIRLRDIPSNFGYSKEVVNYGETDTAEVTYEIVGVYQYLADYSDTCLRNTIYVPESTVPAGFVCGLETSVVQNHISTSMNSANGGSMPVAGEISFRLFRPDYEQAFLGEYAGDLEKMGYEVTILPNNCENFTAAVKPMRRASSFNACVYTLVLLVALCLVEFIYFRARSRELAIVRAMGVPVRRCVREGTLPLMLIALVGVLAGGSAGWWNTMHNASRTLSALAELDVSGEASTALSPLYLVLLWSGILALILALTVGSAAFLARKPVLEQLQGGAQAKPKRSRRMTQEPLPPDAAGLSLEAVRSVRAVIPETPSTRRRTGTVVRFVRRQTTRAPVKSFLAAALAAAFAVGLGFIHLSIESDERQIDWLFENTTVSMEILPVSDADRVKGGGFLYDSTAQTVRGTGLMTDVYLEGAGSGNLITDPTLWNGGNPIYLNLDAIMRDGKKTYTACTFRSFDSAETFLSDQGSGSNMEIEYFDDWDETLFAQDWTEAVAAKGEGAVIPVIIPWKWSAYDGSEGGIFPAEDTVILICRGGLYLCTVAGVCTGSDTVLLPTSALRAMVGEQITYSKASFTVDPSQNRDLGQFRAFIEEIANTPRLGGVPVNISVRDEELTEAVAPLEESLQLMRILYPVVFVLSLLTAVGTAALFVMMSAKDAATLRVLGTPRGRTRIILILQQAATCFAGLVLGVVGMLVYMNQVRPELLEALAGAAVWRAAAYLASAVLGAAASSAAVTNKNPLEMLQVKE